MARSSPFPLTFNFKLANQTVKLKLGKRVSQEHLLNEELRALVPTIDYHIGCGTLIFCNCANSSTPHFHWCKGSVVYKNDSGGWCYQHRPKPLPDGPQSTQGE